MMPAAKHGDPQVGIDIHMCTVPPGTPAPLPTPHTSIVFDPFDYAPIIGATVTVCGMKRATAGTSAKAIHIPPGFPFAPKLPDDEDEIFMGSSTVVADGDPFSYTSVPALSCQVAGMISPPRLKKKGPPKSMLLPTTVNLAIPTSVFVGGPPTISLMALGMKAGMAALGKLGKGLRRLQKGGGRIGRAMKKLSAAMRKKAKGLMDTLKVPPSIQNKVNKAICSVTGHPVDIATGKVFTETIDFELPGPIPFKWERIWYSTSVYRGPLGHGWHHAYDMGLMVDHEVGVVALRMSDGRPVAFPGVEIGQEQFDRSEKLTLFRDEQGYAIRNSECQIYRFTALHGDTEERNLTSVEDLTGNKIRFIYDRSFRLQEIVDSGGRRLRIESDPQGRITVLLAPHPNKPDQWLHAVRYIYDDQGDLIEVLDALDQKTRYQYSDHLLVQETDRNGLSFYFSYQGSDNTAKCIRTWGDKGIYDHKLTYIEAENLTIVENSLGHKTQYYWNENGLVTEAIDPRGNTSLTDYNEYNEILSETDPLGMATSYTYDEYGNQTEIVGPDGATLKVGYDRFNKPVSAEDAIGGTWRWEYDALGRLLKRINPLDETTAYDYAGNRLSGFIDPSGEETRLSYDNQGNLTRILTPDGAQSRWDYDNLGRAIVAIDPKGNKQLRQFDVLGRVTNIQEPDSNLRLLQYDPEGNIIHAKDKQHDVTFAYSGMGRMITRSEAGTTVKFAYDTEEQLIGIKNEQGFVYRFQLDENGEVAVESGFDEVRRIYTRDASGQVEEIKRASGVVTSYQYDLAGRVTAVNHSDSSAETYKYRLDGELEEASNDTSTVKFERDAVGRVLKEWQGDDWISSGYNPLGLRIQMSSSLGARQDIERNSMGDVTRLSYASAQPSQENDHADWEVRFKRDLMGLELERQLPGGLRSRWERDKLGRPVHHRLLEGDKALRDVRYVWDVNDRLRQVIDAQKGITKYHHDSLGNLAAAQYADGTVELRMPDAVGNLFKTKERTDRKYGPAGQLLESYSPEGTTLYEYDAEGNLTRKQEPDGGEWQYHWNAAGMLGDVVRPDQEIVRFTYDALGRRTSKAYQGKITQWIWDGNNPLHEWVDEVPDAEDDSQSAKSDLDGTLIPQSVVQIAHPPTGPPAASVTDSEDELASTNLVNAPKGLVTWLFEPASFAPVAKIVDDRRYSIVTDYLGTPIAMMDQVGRKVWSADISVYGELRNLEGEREDCPFRWPGQYEDVETGLYYNRFRYYAYKAGQYISSDPIGLLGGLALYDYVPNPNGWMDPYGLSSDFLYRADDAYDGGDIGLPKGSDADVTTPWDHVNAKETGQTSAFTSFSEQHNKVSPKFGDKVSKVSIDDLKALEEKGAIKIWKPDDVANAMKKHPKKKVRKEAMNTLANMKRNKEILIEGVIPGEYIKKCK